MDSPAPICIRPTPMEQATAPHMVKMLRPWMKVSRPSDFLPMALSRTGPKARGFLMLYAVRAKATAQMVYRQYWGMDHCHMAWEMAKMAASRLPGSTPAATGGVMGSPMAQKSRPVPMPPHRDMVIQFQVL